VTSIPYNSGLKEKYIPEWLRDMVMKDNIDFVIDKQVFNETFFKMVDELMQHITENLVKTTDKYDADYQINFNTLKQLSLQVSHKVFYDFLTHF